MADNNQDDAPAAPAPPAAQRGAVTACEDAACREKMLRACPIVRMGRAGEPYSQMTPKGIAVIPPEQCIRCGICTKKCAHGATSIESW